MRLRSALRAFLGASMISAGMLHFARAQPFVDIVPAALPDPLLIVYVSGVFEILGGVALFIRRLRRLAGVCLAALYVAVFPANVNMALHGSQFGHLPVAFTWARLPLQLVLIAWALYVRQD